MKRKTLALLLCAVLLLTACTAPPPETTAPPTTQPVETTAPVAATTAPPETTAPAELPRYPINADATYVSLAQELPDHIYTTTGSENGLAGTVYLFEGTVTGHSSTTADGFMYEQITVETEGGAVMFMNFYKSTYNEFLLAYGEATAKAMCPYSVEDYRFPSDGETAEFLGIYIGFSGVAEMPVFYLGANPLMFEWCEYPDPASTQKQPEPTATTEPPETTEPPKTATAGERNALSQAHSYLNFSAFSYSGLIDQLEYEGYTEAEATYAADNCGADWFEQALKEAKSYLSFSAFSHSGLIDQLKYEGYTKEQAVYAADNCGADWMAQAVKCAESYLSFSSFSRSKLIDQLEYEGFTHEQAVYGAEKNGY